MILYLYVSIILVTFHQLHAQTTIISCQSKYTPYFNGTCLTPSNCLGATLTGICASENHVCCVTDPEITVGNTNAMITLSTFQSLVGNTAQSRAYYGLFARAMSEAGVVTCHQAAAFLAHLQGETANFTMFEETGNDTSKYDFDTTIGNNGVGDGDKYRRRGALFLHGKGNYENATLNIAGIKYNLLQEPERAAFPSVAFKIASWTWTKNSYLITQNAPAVKGNLNQLADGTYHNFTLLSHAISTNVQHLKERSILYEDAVRYLKSIGKDCKLIKRGSGVTCEIGERIGKAVPICLSDLERPYCGCGGEFQKNSCPYGFNSALMCRSSSTIKCCYEKCYTALDLVFVLDSSGSIGFADFNKEKQFVVDMVKELDIGPNATRVAIINFGSQIDIITQFNNFLNKTELIDLINRIPYLAQNTNTQGALQVANDVILNESNGMRPITDPVPKVVIVITDGASNMLPQNTIPNAEIIKNRSISIVSVGVGPAINQAELDGMATNPDEVYNVENYDKIFEIIEGLSKTACDQPAKVIFEQVIQSKVEKDFYKYYKLELAQTNDDINDFTIELRELNGACKLFHSFDDQNPKDPNDLIPVNPSNGGSYIEVKRAVDQSSYYQIVRPNNKNVLFLSVKGLLTENEFEIYIHNETVGVTEPTSTAPTTSTVATTTVITEPTQPQTSHILTSITTPDSGSRTTFCFTIIIPFIIFIINYFE